MKKHLCISILVSLPLAAMAQPILTSSFDAPYVLGDLHGQQGWSYTPSATRLQSEFVSIKDSSTIGSLSINERHLFIDANRTASPNNSRRMDQAAILDLPGSLTAPQNYVSFRVAIGNSGTTDNSEVFLSLAPSTNFWGGTFIALKTASQSSGNGTNTLEIYGAGSTPANATVSPTPAFAQETFYWLTLGTVVNNGLITEVHGWLDATLTDGVPDSSPQVSLVLSNPIAPSSTLQLRAQNTPTAITDIVVVPEPSTYAALLGLLALAAVAWRRRR